MVTDRGKRGGREEDGNLCYLLCVRHFPFIRLPSPHTTEVVFAHFTDEETEAQFNLATCLLRAPQ